MDNQIEDNSEKSLASSDLQHEYDKEYSETGFWEKLKKFALKMGKDVVELALTLYYTLQHPDLPPWAKTTIYGALGYLIFPFDAIPDLTPLVGYTDDLGAIVAASSIVAMYITPEIREQARQKLHEWFGTD